MTATALSSLRVLVIDDFEEVRDHHRFVLRSLGITDTVDATDGHDAIRILTDPANQFDLILCDLQMPQLDGIETIRALSYLGVHGAVAVLSVEDEQVMAGAGFLAEAHGLRFIGTIEKPLTAQKLTDTLHRMRELTSPEGNGLKPEPPSARDVARGLELDEFTFFYQPQVHMGSGRLYGVEALLRWRHPTRGLLTAEAFMATVNGADDLVERMTTLVLEHTVAFASRWHRAGRAGQVAVNVPGRALEMLEFPERLDALARQAEIPHETFCVEVAEHELADDPTAIVDVAARLRLKRFRVCIDQFGGSEFGLRHLQHSPVTEVKLARTFVQGCATTPTKQAVLEATITLARLRNVTAAAEGVRHRTDWDQLRALGCDVAQGNFVVRPLGEEVLGEWVGRW